MQIDWKTLDPNAAEEAKKYGRATPSRAFILSQLNQLAKPVSHDELIHQWMIDDEETQTALLHRLKAMCRDGQLESNRNDEFSLIDESKQLTGVMIGHREGFAFVKPEKGGDDIFLPPKEAKRAFDGDKVLIRRTGKDQKGRPMGALIRVVEMARTTLVGRFNGDRGRGILIAENQRIPQNINVVDNPDSGLRYHHGQMVVAKIISPPTRSRSAEVEVVEVLGDAMAPGMEITVALHNYDIPHEWPAEVSQQIGDLSAEVQDSDKQNRVDLRHLPFVTIDGEDARDFDDAVYAEPKRGGGWRLWVAIADVSYYVRPGSALDNEGRIRGNSVYFPESVVPMLPELLSNGLCSLKPKVDRLAMVCEMTISAAGNLSGYKFFEAVIHSHARLTYTKVGAMLSKDHPERDALRAEYAPLVKDIEALHGLYHVLRASRSQRGAIDFETTETRILFNDERKIDRIVPVVRNDAHKLIEECMLCANVATARFLEKLKIPALYRVHEGPKEQRLASLRSYLTELGLALGGGDKPQPKDFLQLAQSIEGRPDRHIIQMMMLRSMRQAVYTPENEGHFGLAYKAYTHFTSPIRRYPDLVIHRLIRAAIHSESDDRAIHRPEGFVHNPDFKQGYSMEQLLIVGENCSMTERRADDATRDVMAFLKCEYMQHQVGEVYEGVVSAVTGFGMFVELKEVFVEGLVHVSSLPGDFYQFDAKKQRLVGERTRRRFGMGDEIVVQVARVDLDDRKIHFEFTDQAPSGGDQKPLATPKKRPVKKRDLLAAGRLGKGESGPKGFVVSDVPRGRTSGAKRTETYSPNGGRAAKDEPAEASKGDGRSASKHYRTNPLSAAEQEVAEFTTKVPGKSKKKKRRSNLNKKAKATGRSTKAAKGKRK
ncbi:MAG: ribonuclease R [Pontibacterium sp.]